MVFTELAKKVSSLRTVQYSSLHQQKIPKLIPIISRLIFAEKVLSLLNYIKHRWGWDCCWQLDYIIVTGTVYYAHVILLAPFV